MSVYLSEEEQIENIKKFWRDYGNIITSIMLAVILSITAWQWWGRHQNKLASMASVQYEQMLDSVAISDDSGVQAHADALIKNYPSTAYAEIAALMIARDAVIDKKYDVAAEKLKWVLANTKNPSFKQIARLRLAKVELAQKQYDQGLSTLETVDDTNFEGLIAQVRGDLYTAMGQREKARMAYSSALQSLPEKSFSRTIVEMKLIDLAEPEHHVAERRKLGVV